MTGIQGRRFRMILLAVTISTLLACSSSPSGKRNISTQAEKGDAKAQFALGQAYSNGQGVTQDYAEALKWFRKAADKGDATAQFNIGVMYKKGLGVQQNFAEAVK